MSTNWLAVNRLDAVPLNVLASDIASAQDPATIELAYVQGVFWKYPKAIGLWHQTPEEGGEAHQVALLNKVLTSLDRVSGSVQCPNGRLYTEVLKLGLYHTAVATRFDDNFTSGLWNVWEVWHNGN